MNKLFSEKNKVPEHYLNLGKVAESVTYKQVKEYEIVLPFKISLFSFSVMKNCFFSLLWDRNINEELSLLIKMYSPKLHSAPSGKGTGEWGGNKIDKE